MDTLTTHDGDTLRVRPIARDDGDRLSRMFTRMSPRTVRLRFFLPLSRLSRGMLDELTTVDRARRDALVVLVDDEIVAVARYAGRPGTGEAEIAVTVEDAWQQRGVGSQLARALAALARGRGYDTLVATMLGENHGALRLVHQLAPRAMTRWSDGTLEVRMPLALAG